MDPSASAGGISIDGILLALFLLALTAIGTMVMVYGNNIRGDISKLFSKLDDHIKDDNDNHAQTDRRVGRIAQRLALQDKRTEDT